MVECGYFKGILFCHSTWETYKECMQPLLHSFWNAVTEQKWSGAISKCWGLLKNPRVPILPTTSNYFFDWRNHLTKFYSLLPGKVDQNHNFWLPLLQLYNSKWWEEKKCWYQGSRHHKCIGTHSQCLQDGTCPRTPQCVISPAFAPCHTESICGGPLLWEVQDVYTQLL